MIDKAEIKAGIANVTNQKIVLNDEELALVVYLYIYLYISIVYKI